MIFLLCLLFVLPNTMRQKPNETNKKDVQIRDKKDTYNTNTHYPLINK